MFQSSQNESGEKVEAACSTLKNKFNRIEDRIKQNEKSDSAKSEKIVKDM